MRLYYNELAPKDYQPPCFKDSAVTEEASQSDSPSTIKLGTVTTPHHSLYVT